MAAVVRDPVTGDQPISAACSNEAEAVVKIAILDDYQNVALSIGDWSAVAKKADITVFNDHIDQTDALIERLLPFDAICVLRERTRGLVGAAELALMKPTARLVNTSRGPIVNEQALIETLRARAIAGAAVGVFDTEPLPAKHPFRSLENLLATPHIGFVAEDLYRTFYGDAAAAIGAWIEKQAPSP